MFRFHKPRDIITLFHNPKSNNSIRILNLLKQTSAMVSAGATGDQASDHQTQNKVQRSEFDLDVTEESPTKDQLTNILEYMGGQGASKVVKGASTQAEAIRMLQKNPDSFLRPVTVDWNNGKAVAGHDESEILKMLNVSPTG